MIEKEKWFNVDAVKAKAEELWQAPCVHMRPDALEKYQKFFDEKCQKSKELTDEARTCIPGAVQHNLSINYPFPIAMKKIEDAYFWDVDGNKYVNYLQAGGPTMLGSNDPEIREKIIELLNGDGPITGLFSEYELLLTKEALAVGVPAYYHTHIQAVPSDDIPAVPQQ